MNPLPSPRLLPLAAAALLLAAGCSGSDKGTPASAAPAPSPKPAATVAPAMASAEGPEWSATVEAPALCKVGERTLARVAFHAKGDWHVNPDYPTAFTPSADGTVKLEGERVAIAAEWKPCGAKGEDKCSGAGSFPFVVPAAGPAKLSGILAFSVCNPEKCLIEKAQVTLALEGR